MFSHVLSIADFSPFVNSPTHQTPYPLEPREGKERGVLVRAHLVTAEQRLKNKKQSRYSNTDEGTTLFLDVEQDLRQGYPVEQIRERVYREYEDWVIKEVIRDIGFTWLINPLADPTLPKV